MADEIGIAVDVAGFESEQKKAAELGPARRDRRKAEKQITLDGDGVARVMRLGIAPTDDSHKFDHTMIKAHVKAIWNGSSLDETSKPVFNHKTQVGVILDKTCFYATMGGQECDAGEIEVIGETKTSASGRARRRTLPRGIGRGVRRLCAARRRRHPRRDPRGQHRSLCMWRRHTSHATASNHTWDGAW